MQPTARRVVTALTIALLCAACDAGPSTPLSAPPPRAPPAVRAFPAAVSADGRFLVDREGKPWRVQADAAWLMSTNATSEEVEAYLRIRRAQGFNSFYLMAMVHPGGYAPAPKAPANQAGDPPFAVPNRFATAGASPESERYWRWIDSILDRAEAHGMTVMLAYAYLGYEGGPEGWYRVLLEQPGRQDCFDYGLWIGKRYRDRKNLLWFALGDYTPPPGSEGQARAIAMIEGIKASGAPQLFMVEASGGASVPTEDAPAYARFLDMNSFYGYGPTGHGECYVEAARTRRVSPPKPAWVQEGGYEFEDNTGGYGRASYETRRTRFWAVLGGATAGDGFGSLPAWKWGYIPSSLDTAGARWSTVAFDLFAGLPWWTLVPSGKGPGFAGRDLVTSGGGRFGYRDWVTAAVTASGSHLLAYVPPRPRGGRPLSRQWFHARLWLHGTGSRIIGIDMGTLAAPARASWVDPESGARIPVADGALLPNEGAREFVTPPGARADGSDDWLLLLEAGEPSATGSASP